MDKKTKSGGSYLSELDAAHAVNAVCDDLGLDRKHPELGDPPSNWKVPSFSINLVKRIHLGCVIIAPPNIGGFHMLAS